VPPVVYVANSEHIRNAAIGILGRWYAVTVFGNPRDALSYLDQCDHSPVVICDHDPPTIDGLDFYERLDRVMRERFILSTSAIDVPSPSGHVVYKPGPIQELRPVIDGLVGGHSP
jgi:DNA-binding NtrC family response regulator